MATINDDALRSRIKDYTFAAPVKHFIIECLYWSRIMRKKKMKSGDLEQINVHAVGIDIGSRSHFVAVAKTLDDEPVREFLTFTEDLHALSNWLLSLGIQSVAMESTGVYWIPVFQILESHGFEVKLVNARHLKNVPGRKTDVLDCQWIQKLHSYGLLEGAYIPDQITGCLRSYLRHRENLLQMAGTHVQHMQKALHQMNLLLHNVVSDITGKTGMSIIRSILNGERNSKKLASLRDKRCKNSVETIQKSLKGHFKKEHLFALKQATELYDTYQQQIMQCDLEIETHLATFADKGDPDKFQPKVRMMYPSM